MGRWLNANSVWYDDTAIAAFAYRFAIRVVMAAMLFAAARRSYGTFVGALVALVVASIDSEFIETVAFFIFMAWAIDCLESRRYAQRISVLTVLAGAFAGFALLGPVSAGITMTFLALVAAVSLPGRRRDRVIEVVSGLVVAVLVVWLATGQTLTALPAYVRNSASIVTGYTQTMDLEAPGLGWEYAAAWVVLALGVVAALQTTVGAPDRRRAGLLVLWAGFWFFEFKEGFVRHDFGHGAAFFATTLGGFVAFTWRPRARLVGLAMTGALVGLTLAAYQASFSAVVTPGSSASAMFDDIGHILSSSQRHAARAQGRRAIERQWPIDAATLALLRGETVHVAPYEAAVAWAYGLHWRPVPVFQSYTAYTARLDRIDAAALSSGRAPQRILRTTEPGIDGRFLPFDEPLATRAMLCRYRELRTTPIWQVLGVGGNRCQATTPLSTVHADWNEKVAVPPPPNDHSFVFAEVGGVSVSGLERIGALAYKPADRTVTLNTTGYRLVAGTAADGLILRAPAGVDFSPPFQVVPNASTIAVGKARQGRTGGHPITHRFFAEPVVLGPRF